ncbi:MAG: hypothetical protein R3B84_14985 [Zavarzinella sp.]
MATYSKYILCTIIILRLTFDGRSDDEILANQIAALADGYEENLKKLNFVSTYNHSYVASNSIQNLFDNKNITITRSHSYHFLKLGSYEKVSMICPKEQNSSTLLDCDKHIWTGLYDGFDQLKHAGKMGVANASRDTPADFYNAYGTPIRYPDHHTILKTLRNHNPSKLRWLSLSQDKGIFTIKCTPVNSTENTTCYIVIDSNKGFLPVETWCVIDGSKVQYFVSKDIVQTPEGAWIPQISYGFTGNFEANKPCGAYVSKFTDIQFGKAKIEDFQIELPKGIQISDQSIPLGFYNHQGGPIHIRDLDKVHQTLIRTGKKTAQREQERRDMGYAPDLPMPEPKSRRWYYTAGGAVFVLLLAAWCLRWRRSRIHSVSSK